MQNRICSFGEIINSEMTYNVVGQIVLQQWEWLQNRYDYVLSHSFVLMPNHIHAILEITNENVGTGRDLSNQNEILDQRTGLDLSLQNKKIKSISEIIGAFKTTSSKKIHEYGVVDFRWQRSFHDHIIRNKESYDSIYAYIMSNPQNWKKDVLYI